MKGVESEHIFDDEITPEGLRAAVKFIEETSPSLKEQEAMRHHIQVFGVGGALPEFNDSQETDEERK